MCEVLVQAVEYVQVAHALGYDILPTTYFDMIADVAAAQDEQDFDHAATTYLKWLDDDNNAALAEEARARGKEIGLCVPMEAKNKCMTLHVVFCRMWAVILS